MAGVLAGRVVLVTGAAGGIGRECALLAAREGASVLVNDLGCNVQGADSDASAAERTAAEIRAAGGKAVANAGSVASRADVEAMVGQALDAFGDLHAVINPAGILRDGMFHKMRDEDWQAVMDVHLRGAYHVSRAAIDHFRAKEDGAYVHFTSISGLQGNIGQANYAAAKLGIVGLSRVLAMEGVRKNIRSNVIAPIAWTRMMHTIPIKDEASANVARQLQQAVRAEQVAQLAVALAAPRASAVSGQIFAVCGDEVTLFSQPRPIRSMTRTEGWSPSSILEHALPAMQGDFSSIAAGNSVFARPA